MFTYTKHDPDALFIELKKVNPDGSGATYIHNSLPGVTATGGHDSTCECWINALYLDKSTPEHAYRLESYRSEGGISATASQQLRCYFISKCTSPKGITKSTREEGRTDMRVVSDPLFLAKASQNTLDIYQEVMWNVEMRFGAVIEVFEVEGSREKRIIIGYRLEGTTSTFRGALGPGSWWCCR